jgi:hypothetical protein
MVYIYIWQRYSSLRMIDRRSITWIQRVQPNSVPPTNRPYTSPPRMPPRAACLYLLRPIPPHRHAPLPHRPHTSPPPASACPCHLHCLLHPAPPRRRPPLPPPPLHRHVPPTSSVVRLRCLLDPSPAFASSACASPPPSVK